MATTDFETFKSDMMFIDLIKENYQDIIFGLFGKIYEDKEKYPRTEVDTNEEFCEFHSILVDEKNEVMMVKVETFLPILLEDLSKLKGDDKNLKSIFSIENYNLIYKIIRFMEDLAERTTHDFEVEHFGNLDYYVISFREMKRKNEVPQIDITSIDFDYDDETIKIEFKLIYSNEIVSGYVDYCKSTRKLFIMHRDSSKIGEFILGGTLGSVGIDELSEKFNITKTMFRNAILDSLAEVESLVEKIQ